MVDTAIGKVIYGMDTLKAMENVPVNEKYRPTQDILIRSVTIHANPFAPWLVWWRDDLIVLSLFTETLFTVYHENNYVTKKENGTSDTNQSFRMQKKVIGIDCDEVLCLLMQDFIQYMNQRFNIGMKYEDLKEYDLNKYFGLDRPDVRFKYECWFVESRCFHWLLQGASQTCSCLIM